MAVGTTCSPSRTLRRGRTGQGRHCRRRGRCGCGTTDPPASQETAFMTDRETPRRTAADFHPEVLKLFDKYVHGAIDRRGFLDGAARFAVGGVTAAGLLEALSPNFAAAQQVPQDRCADQDRDGRLPVAQGYGTAAATWCGRRARRPQAARRPACRWCWWCTRTAASIRTSRTSPAAWRSTTSSPSRPTPCSRSAAIRATRTRRASCSASSTRPRRARTSSPRRRT